MVEIAFNCKIVAQKGKEHLSLKLNQKVNKSSLDLLWVVNPFFLLIWVLIQYQCTLNFIMGGSRYFLSSALDHLFHQSVHLFPTGPLTFLEDFRERMEGQFPLK